MNFQMSKTYVALALTGAIAGFIAVAEVMHPSRGLPVSALTDADSGAARAASAPAMPVRVPYVERRPVDGRTACRQDAQRLCTGIAPGEGRIVRCLVERGDEVSPVCRSAMAEQRMNRTRQRETMENSQPGNAQARMGVPAGGGMRAACGQDFQQFCAGVERGGGRVIRCLAERSADLSSSCRSFVQQIAARRGGGAFPRFSGQ
jgi:hypothetical protein